RASGRSFAAVVRAIRNIGDAGLTRAVSAAEILAARLHTVPDDRHLALMASWCERVDRALERVERVRRTADRDIERLVVVVEADFAHFHGSSTVHGTCR